MRSYKKSIFVFLFLIFSFVFVSCRKNDQSNKISTSETGIESELSDKTTLVFGEDRNKTESVDNSSSDNKGFSEIEKGDLKGQLFSINSISVIPEDMVIGTLLNFNFNTASSGSFLFAINTFFTDAGKGILNLDVLHPSWSSSIQKLYRNSLSEQYFIIRIGDTVIKNGISKTNIRLIGKTGRTSGYVSADFYEGKWLLSDISIDIEQLQENYLREEIEFNPLSYSNILLNY